MKQMIRFIRKELILVAAILLAVLSSFMNPPSLEYIQFVDFRVLGILLSLMLVMSGLQKNGVFQILGKSLVQKCKSTRSLSWILVFLCFLTSMLVTNDVALITFVPFAILTLQMTNQEDLMVPVITAQTIAANLGSMLTPMGNPQNLYLYHLSGMSLGSFIRLMLPYTIVSGILLGVLILTMKKREFVYSSAGNPLEKKDSVNHVQVGIYMCLFAICIGAVVHRIEWYIALFIVIAAILLMDKSIIKTADYALLFTFAGFFLFIGNAGKISAVREFLAALLKGREFLTAILTSQIISNVPTAILLSGFTQDYKVLIIGTNLGGLGTLIASMASLISYKQLANVYPEKKGRYLVYFSVVNILFLVLLYILHVFCCI